MTAYATLADVKASMNFGTDSSRDAHLTDLLDDATAYIDGECDRSFARNPAISTGTFLFRIIRPHNRLSIAMGTPGVDIVSITTLEYASSEGQPYTTIPTTGYFLIGNDGPEANWPYGDIELARSGAPLFFPVGNAIVRLTGVLGFATVPHMVRRAAIDMVHEWYRQGAQGGVPAGVNQYGTPLFVQGEPHTLRSLKSAGSPYTRNAVGWVR
jgi:hypothetical protein